MRGVLFKFLGLLLLAVSFAGGWLLLEYRTFLRTPLAVDESGAVLEVPAGANLGTLARDLHARGWLEHPLYLRVLGRWQGSAQQIKAGEYRIAPGTTPEHLLRQLVEGRVLQHSLTVVEGWTFQQLRAAVAAHKALRHTLTEFDDAELMAALGHEGVHPEGRFYPETYRFPRGTSDREFLRRAYDVMAQRLQREWEQRSDDLPVTTPDEALVLASIIEKETAVDSERGHIAGVFVRRLRRGMRLQTDPTVIYGMGDAYDGNIRRRDLRTDTPYNTYTRSGLPPTPIALPSGASIHAALHPESGDSLYFVSRGDGSHVFSATLEEHNRAVTKYQLGGQRR